MQNITVKVCYKGKTLIVGKGITPIDGILKELVKRFPEVEQIQEYLTVEYENGAQDLLSAYSLAEKENKRFIKVKFNYGQQNQRSFVSDRLDESTNVLVVDQAQEKNEFETNNKFQDLQTEVRNNSQQKSDVFEPLEDKQQGLINQTVTQSFFKKDIPESEQTLLVEPLIKLSEEEDESKNEIQNLKNESPNNEEIQLQIEKGLKIQNPIDYSLLNQDFQDKKKKEFCIQNADSKRNAFEKIFGFQVNRQQKKQESLSSESMIILETVRKEFNSKIITIQIQYEELNVKYNDLALKYDNLMMSFDQNKEQKVEEKMNPSKFGYEKIPQKDPSEKSKLNLPVEYFAEISEFDTIEEVQVGGNIESRFRFKNVGHNQWPENLFAYEQSSQDHVPIKSLKPKESAIVLLHTEKVSKVGEKINRIYQLVYFDEKNNARKFGRQFGISVRVIGPVVVSKPQVPQPNKIKKSDQTIQFREYINDIMKRNKMTGKTLYDVIGYLKEFDVTAHNYNTYEAKTLTQFIRSIFP